MILITILEILIPNHSMKPYVKIVVGLLVMLSILQPLIKIKNGEIQFEEKILEASEAIDEYALSFQANSFQESQNKQLISLYKMRIETDIRERIEAQYPVQIVNIRSEIEENTEKETFGSIKSLHIVFDRDIDSNQVGEIKKEIHSLYGTNEKDIYIDSKW